MLKVIKGDLFDTKAKYLCHQCNCLTTKSAHLAYNVFKKYPYADVYSPRKETVLKNAISEPEIIWSKDIPGDIIIKGDGKDYRYVVALLGQYYPGRSRYPNSTLDGVCDGCVNLTTLFYKSLSAKSPHTFEPDGEAGYTRICIYDELGYWNMLYWSGGKEQIIVNSSVCSDKMIKIEAQRQASTNTEILKQEFLNADRSCVDETHNFVSWEDYKNGISGCYYSRIKHHQSCEEDNKKLEGDKCIVDENLLPVSLSPTI